MGRVGHRPRLGVCTPASAPRLGVCTPASAPRLGVCTPASAPRSDLRTPASAPRSSRRSGAACVTESEGGASPAWQEPCRTGGPSKWEQRSLRTAPQGLDLFGHLTRRLVAAGLWFAQVTGGREGLRPRHQSLHYVRVKGVRRIACPFPFS